MASRICQKVKPLNNSKIIHEFRFEIVIRTVDPTLAVPYWDSTLDGALPTPADSIMFTDAFMGMNDAAGNLVRGPFAGWRTLTGRPNIQRRIGAQGMLLTEQNM